MTNQQVVNYVRQHLAEKTKLEEICEQMMDHCLAPDSEGGVGCDNMSVMIIAILNGKTEEEWYNWMATRCAAPKKDGLGNDIVSTTTNLESVPATTENDTITKP
jgi:serine/threonine protein phosphatase PrpC